MIDIGNFHCIFFYFVCCRLGSSTSETLVFCSDSSCSLTSRAASTSQPQCITADVQDQSQSTAQCAFSVAYGDKSQMQGVLTRDIISIGSVSVSAYFGRILSSIKQGGTTGLFEPTGVDGIFGLGKTALNCQPTCFPTVLDSFANAGYLNPFVHCVVFPFHFYVYSICFCCSDICLQCA
jgi:hypothetical protein